MTTQSLTVTELADLCEKSRDADVPTPLEFAFSLIADAAFEDQQTQLLAVENDDDENLFKEGWNAGINGDLDISTMPGSHEGARESRAWLAGFAAGQYALANGFRTPYCILSDHDHGDDWS